MFYQITVKTILGTFLYVTGADRSAGRISGLRFTTSFSQSWIKLSNQDLADICAYINREFEPIYEAITILNPDNPCREQVRGLVPRYYLLQSRQVRPVGYSSNIGEIEVNFN